MFQFCKKGREEVLQGLRSQQKDGKKKRQKEAQVTLRPQLGFSVSQVPHGTSSVPRKDSYFTLCAAKVMTVLHFHPVQSRLSARLPSGLPVAFVFVVDFRLFVEWMSVLKHKELCVGEQALIWEWAETGPVPWSPQGGSTLPEPPTGAETPSLLECIDKAGLISTDTCPFFWFAWRTRVRVKDCSRFPPVRISRRCVWGSSRI